MGTLGRSAPRNKVNKHTVPRLWAHGNWAEAPPSPAPSVGVASASGPAADGASRIGSSLRFAREALSAFTALLLPPPLPLLPPLPPLPLPLSLAPFVAELGLPDALTRARFALPDALAFLLAGPFPFLPLPAPAPFLPPDGFLPPAPAFLPPLAFFAPAAVLLPVAFALLPQTVALPPLPPEAAPPALALALALARALAVSFPPFPPLPPAAGAELAPNQPDKLEVDGTWLG